MAEPRQYEATFEAHIPAPVEDVFALLADVTRTPEWRSHLDEVAWLERDRTFRVVTSFGPWRRLELTAEVTAFERDRRFAYRVTDGPLRARNVYRVAPADGGTSFCMSGAAGMPGVVMRVAGPLVAWAYRRTARREVDRLKDLLS